jgi:hypothetical protein
VGISKPSKSQIEAKNGVRLEMNMNSEMDVSATENHSQKPPKPPLTLLTITCELLAGLIGAITGVAPILSLLYQEAQYGELGEFAGLGLFALVWTYPFGALITAVGVYLAGSARNQTGSFWAALAGTALGAAAVFAVAVGAVAGDCSIVGGAMFAIALAAPVLGATIGFNLTRRYKSPPTSR